MEQSKFQFKSFSIVRSLLERNENKSSKKISLAFNPRGFIHEEDLNFQLLLGVKIEDKNKSFNVDIEAIANYTFENKTDIKNLNNFFYINAPALLFPYIRAYISTLTNLSGLEPINLPTLNMTQLGNDLRKKTTVVAK